jgi:hypothetical protein
MNPVQKPSLNKCRRSTETVTQRQLTVFEEKLRNHTVENTIQSNETLFKKHTFTEITRTVFRKKDPFYEAINAAPK